MRVVNRSGASAIPVLLYHSIPTREDRDPLSVFSESFLADLHRVRRSGRVPLTISQLAAGLRGVSPLPERAVAITFDDGHANNLAAIERVLELDLRATVYLTTGTRGTPATLDPRALDAMAPPEQIEIGAHSVTHPRLDELDPSSMATEVTVCKAELEQLLAREITSFAYPYGFYDGWVRHTVVSAGYSSAVAVKNALSYPQDDPWAIARFTRRKSNSADDITRVLEGEGVQQAWSGERLRTRAYRSVRRLRRQLGGGGTPSIAVRSGETSVRPPTVSSAFMPLTRETNR